MPAAEVVSVFSRFDKDGSGTMSQDQLSAVFKALNQKALAPEEIDCLVRAGKCKDGKLNIEEFVAWLFAAVKPPAPKMVTEGCGRAARVDGGFGWLMKANSKSDREARQAIGAATREAVKAGGFQLGSAVIQLQHVREMLEGTRLLSPNLPGWPQLPKSTLETTELLVERGTVMDVAVNWAKKGEKVVAVNAASAYHAGGGFLTGGRHALEEAMCVQSSLYESLEQGISLAEDAQLKMPSWARPPARRDGSPWVLHLPDDGVLLSPMVEVFRDGTMHGYGFRETATVLTAVVSVAMPNCNEKMSDSPVDAHPETEGYKKQLSQKWLAVLQAASSCLEATTLVVPDAGCGVFYNQPEAVGTSFGEVLRQFRGRFARVLISFPGGKAGERFAAAAQVAFGGS